MDMAHVKRMPNENGDLFMMKDRHILQMIKPKEFIG
jgi:hypothetical protein